MNIKNAATVGGGVIGSGWTLLFAMHGIKVTMYDINDDCLNAAQKTIGQYMENLIDLGAIEEEGKDRISANILFTTSMEEAVQGAEFIQENGPERLEIKRSIIAQIERYASKEALIASSSSGLLISDIVADATYPERIIGGHPYNPPHLIPLVEMTYCDKTDPVSVQRGKEFYQAIGKEAVILNKECPGYIANRLQLAVYREMIDLVCKGVCSVEDADKSLVYGPGLRWAVFGHNMIMQLGNPGGLKGMLEMLGNAGDVWLNDMADWKHIPDDYAIKAQQAVNEMMKNYPDAIGHTNEEIIHYRDKMLVNILKLHGKL